MGDELDSLIDSYRECVLAGGASLEAGARTLLRREITRVVLDQRRALAETLQTIDFADDVQKFLDALDDERDTPGDCKQSTLQLDALIRAVAAKTLSEVK